VVGRRAGAALGLTVRPATLDDTDAVAEILDECTRRYFDRPSTVDDAVERLREGEPLVALLDEVPAGFSHVWTASHDEMRTFTRVRPSLKGHGIGTALLAGAERLAGDAALLTATCWAADDGAPSVLESRGFDPLRFFQRMRVELPAAAAPTEPPAGVTLRPFVPGDDDAAMYLVYHEVFSDHWGGAQDEASWWRENRDAGNAGYDPSLWLLAESDRETLGFLIAREREDEGETIGWVSLLGVAPAARGRGLGEALLTHGLAALRERGLRVAALNVDSENTSGALRLYRKVGMDPQPSFTIWGKRPRSA
jgi:mycothiol synthase